MFKKIRSNIDPDVTVTREIRKEFEKYFDKSELKIKGFLGTYPKQIFIAMLVMIIISAIICFLISTSEQQKKNIPDFLDQTTSMTTNVSDGMGEIIELGTRVNDIYQIKRQVEQIISKDKLTKSDSVFLEKAIIVLESNNKLIR